MATYVPGIQEYVPQFQPFQPDYNFLGNVLQTKQSQYDANYKQLSQRYGTLLNSDMLRADNIEKRNEFFKMIDQDIKKISGLDLSLQQNVNSANKVFDSFLQNKDMVHDMNYTREYQNQLGIAEQYRNCLDQKKCGGYYWETGVNALNYRADEFKKASSQDAMKMSPGKYVPQINIQEAATEYLKDLLGKDSGSAFGVESVTFSPDKKYRITLKNGANLVMPYQQLMQAMYGKDQRVIDMYNTQAYVTRKGFISQNAQKYGSEEAAENKYFESLDEQFKKTAAMHKTVQDLQNMSKAKMQILAKEIAEKGSDGKDDLAKDFYGAGVDNAIASKLVNIYAENYKNAESLYKPDADLASKRLYADNLYSSSLMNKEINDAAIRAASMTGSIKMEADEYAKSYYDHSLNMAEISARADLEDRNNRNKAYYQLNRDVTFEEYKKRGNAFDMSNEPRYVDAHPGTTAITGEDIASETQQRLAAESAGMKNSALSFVNGYSNTLSSIASNSKASADEQTMAKGTLKEIYGEAKKDASGKYISPGYDPKTNMYVDRQGNTYNSPEKVSSIYNQNYIYNQTKKLAEQNKNISSHANFLNGDGAKFNRDYDTYSKSQKATSMIWQENNKNVASYGRSKLGGKKGEEFSNLFTSDYNLKTKDDYIKSYLAKSGSADIGDAEDAYEEATEKYNKYYASGTSIGKDGSGNAVPLVKSTNGASMLGFYGGGKSAGGALMYEFNSEVPGAAGTKGMLTLFEDAMADTQSIWAIGDHATLDSAKDSQKEKGVNAKLALTTFIRDFKTGNLTKTEKDMFLGQVLYMDVAAGDASKVGMTIKLPPSWLQKYKGSDKKPKWADDINLAAEGVSVYTDKSKARNHFTESVRAKPYDYILDHMSTTIEYPNAGTLTINKRNSNGSIVVSGSAIGYDADGKPHPVSLGKEYTNDVGGQNLYDALNMYMSKISQANTIYLQSKGRRQAFTNPGELPDVKKYLEMAAGGGNANQGPMSIDDVNQMFIRGLQGSLFQSN